MSIKTDIYLNKLAQGLEETNRALEFFSRAECGEQIEILNRLAFFIIQAGANTDHIEIAITHSGLKGTYTPCSILKKVVTNQVTGSKGIKVALSKIIALPENERNKSFKLMISLFSIVDKYKRDKGLRPDVFWWHRDLMNEDVVNDIILNASNH